MLTIFDHEMNYFKDRPIKLHLNLKIRGTDFVNDKVDINSSLCFSEIVVVQCHKYKQSCKSKWNKVLSFFFLKKKNHCKNWRLLKRKLSQTHTNYHKLS